MFQLLPQVRVIQYIFIELKTTEKQYIDKLTKIIQEYLIPLRSKTTDAEELKDIIAIFSNIETIVEVHQKLFKGLLHIQDEFWPVVKGLGHLFLKFSSKFQIYGDYAENYKTSQVTLQKVLSQKRNRLKDTIEVCFFIFLTSFFIYNLFNL